MTSVDQILRTARLSTSVWGAGIRWPAPQFQLWEILKKGSAQPGIRIYHTHQYPSIPCWQGITLKEINTLCKTVWGPLTFTHTFSFFHLFRYSLFIFCLKPKTLNHKSIVHLSTCALAFGDGLLLFVKTNSFKHKFIVHLLSLLSCFGF